MSSSVPSLVMVRRKAINLIKYKNWSYAKVARYLGYNRSTIMRWHKRYKEKHYFGLYDRSKRPKTIDKKTTPFEHQELIVKLRKQTRYCHQKLAILLKQDHDLDIKPITIDEEFYNRGIRPKSIHLLNKQLQEYLEWYNTKRIHLSLKNITPENTVKQQELWLKQINQFVADVLKH